MNFLSDKTALIGSIKINIENLQYGINNELYSPDEIRDIKLDLDSLKTILGHLTTLKTF